MNKPAMRLLDTINGERLKLKMSHRAFSKFLGIDPAYWHRIRHGNRALTLKILTLFMQKLPQVTPEVTIFIMRQKNDGDAPKLQNKVGVKNSQAYKDVCRPHKNPKKPSKIAK